jgi:RNA polymerase sigma factor (sigma-70 family)
MSPSIPVRLLATQSDARLVELAAQGHERAFEALVLRYRRALLGYCRALPLSGGLAEDAVQQGLLQAWLALQAGTEVRDPKPWLYRIVRNAALNMRRGAAAEHSELAETLRASDGPEDELHRQIAIRGVLAGLAGLPEQQREALLRTAVEGHSHAQVAATLGLSDGAVRGLVYRARATLRAAATAITPSPLLNWALSSGARGGPSMAALVELSAGGGSAGLAGLLLKGGVVVATAGALVTSIGVAGPHSASHRPHRAATHAVATSRPSATQGVAPLIARRPQPAVTLADRAAAARIAPPRIAVRRPPRSESADGSGSSRGGGDGSGERRGSGTNRGGDASDGGDGSGNASDGGGGTPTSNRAAGIRSSATRKGSGDGGSGSSDGGSGSSDGGSGSSDGGSGSGDGGSGHGGSGSGGD